MIKDLVAGGEFTLAELKDYFTAWIFEPQLIEKTNKCVLYWCPACGSKISVYKVYFSKMHVEILIKIFKWAVENKTHEFAKSEIKGLTHTEYGNFYTLQRFWLLYFLKDKNGKRVKGWYWGIPIQRAYKFLQGQTKISEYYTRNTATGQNIASENKVFVSQIKVLENTFTGLAPSFISYDLNERERQEAIKQNELAKEAYTNGEGEKFADLTFKR